MGLERFEEVDNFFFFDTALLESEQAVGACQPSYDRYMVPVEVKLNDRRLSFGSPSPYSGRTLADSGLVDKKRSAGLLAGLFFKGGPSTAFPGAHCILIAFNGTLLWLLWAKTHRSDDAPDLRLAKPHAMQPLDDCANPFEGP